MVSRHVCAHWVSLLVFIEPPNQPLASPESPLHPSSSSKKVFPDSTQRSFVAVVSNL